MSKISSDNNTIIINISNYDLKLFELYIYAAKNTYSNVSNLQISSTNNPTKNVIMNSGQHVLILHVDTIIILM